MDEAERHRFLPATGQIEALETAIEKFYEVPVGADLFEIDEGERHRLVFAAYGEAALAVARAAVLAGKSRLDLVTRERLALQYVALLASFEDYVRPHGDWLSLEELGSYRRTFEATLSWLEAEPQTDRVQRAVRTFRGTQERNARSGAEHTASLRTPR